jgi:hypothetical protein
MITFTPPTAARFGRQLTGARLAQGRSKQEVAFAVGIPVERLRILEAGGQVDAMAFSSVAQFLGVVLVLGNPSRPDTSTRIDP